MSAINTNVLTDSPGMQGDASKGSGEVKKLASGWNKDSRMSTSSVLYNSEGAKPEVGGVLGLRHEKIKVKVMYVFNPKFKPNANPILKTLNPIPTLNLNANSTPYPLTATHQLRYY